MAKKEGRLESDPHISAWQKQMGELRAKRDASKPVSQKLADAGHEISKLEQKESDRQSKLEALQDKLAEMQD